MKTEYNSLVYQETIQDSVFWFNYTIQQVS